MQLLTREEEGHSPYYSQEYTSSNTHDAEQRECLPFALTRLAFRRHKANVPLALGYEVSARIGRRAGSIEKEDAAEDGDPAECYGNRGKLF